ncbi:unnamed protein product [Peniophora sp. CBMAI 1063]|nr:unnamed protein product [Peniophora sp. CBMAI 1063]
MSSTQYMWKELCVQISELADATAAENEELIATKKKLEAELQQLKRTTTTGFGTHRMVSSASAAPGPDGPSLALCVVDGWRTSFAVRFVKQGEAGGRAAGQALLRALYTELELPPGISDAQLPVWTSVFLSSRALVAGLVKQETCSSDEIEGFVKGLVQSHKSLVLVDVASKKDVDEKMRAYMTTFSRLPQVKRVFFAGGFASPFASIARELPYDKLVFLRNKGSATPPAMDPKVPVLFLEDVFADMSLFDTTVNPTSPASPVTAPSPTPPLFSPGLFSGSMTRASGGRLGDDMLRSPMSVLSEDERPVPVIDTTLPLNKQVPPPCYLHYLLGKCSHGGICTYEHRYELTETQLKQLRQLAKKQPCAFAAKGQMCLFDEQCVYGHECPYGIARCRFLVEEKCRFTREMHK